VQSSRIEAGYTSTQVLDSTMTSAAALDRFGIDNSCKILKCRDRGPLQESIKTLTASECGVAPWSGIAGGECVPSCRDHPTSSIDWEELQIPPSGRDDKGSAVTYLGSCDLGCVDFRVEGSSEFPSGRD
jgi:hypothetical protein